MPELPEVETIKKFLQRKIKGKIIRDIKVLNKKQVQGNYKKFIGEEIVNINRRGKFLIFQLKGNKLVLIHLKMTGQFLIEDKPNKFTRIIFHLSSAKDKNKIEKKDCSLIFNDIRKFGYIKFIEKEEKSEFKKIGPEPQELTFQYLKDIFSKSQRAIKLVLMDQNKIAGLGNIYANESLFLAKINPLKSTNKLTDKEIKRLLEAIKLVIKKAIKYGGTSFNSYLKPNKSKGKYQNIFLIYQRKGEKCWRCKQKIQYIKIGNRGTFFCPSCQKWKD